MQINKVKINSYGKIKGKEINFEKGINIIYGKNENTKSAMASTTKIMTATIVLENANLTDTVTVSSKAGGTGGSRLVLKKRR